MRCFFMRKWLCL